MDLMVSDAMQEQYRQYYQEQNEDSPYKAREFILAHLLKKLQQAKEQGTVLHVLDIGAGPQTMLGYLLGVYGRRAKTVDSELLGHLKYTSVDFGTERGLVGTKEVEALAECKHYNIDFTDIIHRSGECSIGGYAFPLHGFDLIISNMAFDFIRFIEWQNRFVEGKIRPVFYIDKEQFWKTRLDVDIAVLHLLRKGGSFVATLHNPLLLQTNPNLINSFVGKYLEHLAFRNLREIKMWNISQKFHQFSADLGRQFQGHVLEEAFWEVVALHKT